MKKKAIFKIIIGVSILVAIFQFISLSTKISKTSKELDAKKIQLQDLKDQNETLKKQVEDLKNGNNTEKNARERLKKQKNGEIPIIQEKTKDISTNTTTQP